MKSILNINKEYQKLRQSNEDVLNNISVGKAPITDYVDVLRAKTFEAEALMRAMPQIELKVIHHFAPGLYARELHIPAGVTLTGQIHKFKNLNILSKGSMLVSTDEGMVKVEEGFHVVSPAGTKRIAHALEDCIWTTILATDETDVPTIEKLFVTNDENEWLAFSGADQLGFEL